MRTSSTEDTFAWMMLGLYSTHRRHTDRNATNAAFPGSSCLEIAHPAFCEVHAMSAPFQLAAVVEARP